MEADSMKRFEHATVVVVGGSRGIGLAVATGAAREGARVVVYDIAQDRLRMLAETDPGIATHVLDINDAHRVEAAFAEQQSVDHIYVAAGSTKLGKLADTPVAEQIAPLLTRLVGSANVIRAAAKRMRAGGSITLTGGVSTDRPVPGAWVSSVATAAAEQLARSMALELAPIRVNAVAPGWTDTPMWDDVLGSEKANVFAAITDQQLTRRLATADEVADAVLFLMGNGSVTGEVLHVDGGRRLT